MNALCLGFVGIVVREMVRNRDDLAANLGFYGTYHREPRNQMIHFVFVPALLYSFILFFAHLPFLGLDLRVGSHRITYGTIIAAAYCIFYLYLDSFGGLLYSVVITAMYSNATRTVSNDRSDAYIRSTKKKDGGGVSWTGTGHPLKLAAAVQVIGWWAQLHPGHAIFEGAKPALLDGFGQALSVAPLFAFYEGLWACGIHTGLQARTLQLVAANTKALCAAGATLRACAGA
jgi:uncharacterized membrane protein YGL010W